MFFKMGLDSPGLLPWARSFKPAALDVSPLVALRRMYTNISRVAILLKYNSLITFLFIAVSTSHATFKSICS